MRKLLIVDDERIIREGLAKSLDWQSLGIDSVETAPDGKKAYEKIKKDSIDIVVTDIVMPELDGIGLIQRCAGEQIRTQFVILSSYDDFQYAQQAIRSGVCEYILKPCDPLELKKVLVGLIEKMNHSDEQLNSSAEALDEIKNILPHAKVKIMEELLHTVQPDAGRAESLRKLLHLNSDSYRLILYPLEWSSDRQPATDALIQKIESNFPDTVSCTESNHLLVIAGQTPSFSLSELALSLQKITKHSGFTDTTILVSEPTEFSKLYQSYQKAISLSHVLFYFNHTNILMTDRITLQENPDAHNTEGLLVNFTEAMKTNQTSLAIDLFQELFELFRKEKYSFEIIRKICLRLYLTTLRDKKLEETKYVDNISLLSYADNAQNLYDILLQEINRIVVSRKEKLYSTFSKPIRITIDYIAGHLSDSELSLSQVASKVLFINADYLGKLFKKECGIKFSNYLLTLRMDEAKSLLHTTDLPIQQIALEVGFTNNPSYFSQIFKKFTGMLPKEYRNEVLKAADKNS